MRICLLDSNTKRVVNVVSLNKPEDHIETPGIEIAPQHDGNIGWVWNGSGWDYPKPPEPTQEELEEYYREVRNKWLGRHVDSINAVRWNSFTQEEKDTWMQYRQDLLNIPQQEGFPYNIVWPTKPE